MAMEFWVEIVKVVGALAGPVLGYTLSTLRSRRKRWPAVERRKHDTHVTVTLRSEVKEAIREMVVGTLIQYLGVMRKQLADVNEAVSRCDVRIGDAIGRFEQQNAQNREERQAMVDRIVALQKNIERKIAVDEELAQVVAELRKVLA